MGTNKNEYGLADLGKATALALVLLCVSSLIVGHTFNLPASEQTIMLTVTLFFVFVMVIAMVVVLLKKE